MKKYFKFLILSIIIIFSVFNTYRVNALDQTSRKIVYLTFDDGPSPNNTENILQILNENNVRATFCVVGSNALRYKEILKQLNEYNMGIIPHCNNHQYKELYSSTEYYINDLNECTRIINDVTGGNRSFRFVRMPGGSDNTVSNYQTLQNIKSELRKRGMDYIDWSIDSGDTCAAMVPEEQITSNIENQAGINNIEVILMHDLENKVTTTSALQDIIIKYKSLGYEFKTFDEMEEWEVQYLIGKHVIDK
ncbi:MULTISPECIES: polysaccharide deacetylase family protein [Clostridium]|uniref:Polysaccharide deacetylase family protein n=1 Tax=Clostridium aquiflavi TaxID=3073603 RepID=A0ABU1EJT3_9CLOT|nr:MULTISPECIES: polysaccharide deacetylase family protein [unclassified Clostridium]MDR5588655.1 polysaccharide deacetylase family protein [Clostridium sp. 5N-1]NFG63289.1 polysaccharide deacetylase [Clostridium botulinum]NFQ08792.1 polysaccharide deacetylase [Clostridium botulinum]